MTTCLLVLLSMCAWPMRAEGAKPEAGSEDMRFDDRPKDLVSAACDGNEAGVRTALSRGLTSWPPWARKRAAKALKCARKKGHAAIAALIARAEAGEELPSAAQEEAEKAADAAVSAGDKPAALARCREALEDSRPGSAFDLRLRGKAIRLALGMSPSPPVPEEARRAANRGAFFMKKAEGAEDYGEAVAELLAATRLAPWWPDAYYNLGLVQEKSGDYDGAMASLRLYLLAAPQAADRAEVSDKLDELAVEKRMAERRRAEEDEAARPGRTR